MATQFLISGWTYLGDAAFYFGVGIYCGWLICDGLKGKKS